MLQSAEVPFGAGEVFGIIAALIILAIVFRSLIPAFIPIVTAIVGVGVSMLALVALSAGLDIPSVTTALGAMLGLAVGIDYALFILSATATSSPTAMTCTSRSGSRWPPPAALSSSPA